MLEVVEAPFGGLVLWYNLRVVLKVQPQIYLFNPYTDCVT